MHWYDEQQILIGISAPLKSVCVTDSYHNRTMAKLGVASCRAASQLPHLETGEPVSERFLLTFTRWVYRKVIITKIIRQ